MDQFRRSSLTFDVRDGGPRDGEPVVLLHGFPEDAQAWAAVEPHLHEAGFRTLAPDQRGYSPGARPKGRRQYVGGELIGDVVALLDEARIDRAHLVGHDWGGGVAWGMAAAVPDRLQSLTVLATPHPAAMVRAGLRGQFLKSWYMLAFQVPFVPDLVLSRIDAAKLLRRSGLPADIAAHNAARMAEPGALTGGINWYRALPFTLREPIGKIAVPTTYVWGNRDAFLGRAAAEGTAQFVTGDYRFVELDADHWLPSNQPERIAQIVIDRARPNT